METFCSNCQQFQPRIPCRNAEEVVFTPERPPLPGQLVKRMQFTHDSQTMTWTEEIFKVDLDSLLDDVDQSFWKTSRFLHLPVYHPVRPVFELSQYFYCL